jgi:hypothetical protein
MTDDARDQPFTPRDDGFHFDVMGDDGGATETAWFSFHHPDRALGGWLYTMVRPNIGTVAGGAWVWDASTALPWEVPYSANFTALELPRNSDLADIEFPTGVCMKVLAPTMSYALRFSDPGRLEIDLRYDGAMQPRRLASSTSTFGRSAHFDQFGRVTGRVVVANEQIDIDCIAMRDRTWGRRPEDRPRRAAYVTGAASTETAFLAVTSGEQDVTYGFAVVDGVASDVKSGSRAVRRDPTHGWVTEITLSWIDALGRRGGATGYAVSRIIVNRHSFIDVNSLIRWDLNDGVVAWGEDQDMWPVSEWASFRRQSRAGQHRRGSH